MALHYIITATFRKLHPAPLPLPLLLLLRCPVVAAAVAATVAAAAVETTTPPSLPPPRRCRVAALPYRCRSLDIATIAVVAAAADCTMTSIEPCLFTSLVSLVAHIWASMLCAGGGSLRVCLLWFGMIRLLLLLLLLLRSAAITAAATAAAPTAAAAATVAAAATLRCYHC